MTITTLLLYLASQPTQIAQSFALDLHQRAPLCSLVRPRSGVNYRLRLRVDDEAEEDWPEPTLEESFDAIDDVYLERPPGRGRDKIKVFGAWLDADVAGRKAGQGNRAAALIERASRGETLTDAEQAEVFYEEAIANMRKGSYDTSYTMLEKAVALAGEDSRRGGEFKLWAVQALQGVGRNEQSVQLLKSMKNHRDPDVRKVSSELLFIAEAPLLELSREDYVPISDMSYVNKASGTSNKQALAGRAPGKTKGLERQDRPSEVTQAEAGLIERAAPAFLVAGACIMLTLYITTTSQ